MIRVMNRVVIPTLAVAALCACGSGGGIGKSVAATSADGACEPTAGADSGKAGDANNAAAGTSSSGGANSAGGMSQASGGAGSGFTGGPDTPTGGANPTDCAMPGGIPTSTAKGTPGTWENVSPSGISFDYKKFNNDNFGLQDVLVDPVRPSDFYAFVCHQGVWRSTDYGSTWTKINTGKNGDVVDTGKPWGAGIDSNRCRDPNKPPRLYTLNGGGSANGFLRSDDGGVNWTLIKLPDNPSTQYPQDAYSIAVDPYDGNHILMGYHEAVGLLESRDAGDTWKVLKPGDDAISVYNFFIDTGDAATTGKTWLSIGQSGSMWRTTDGAGSWSKVESLQHSHGCSQIFQAGGGVIYAPGTAGSAGAGVYRSKDYGKTWAQVVGDNANNVIGTPTTLYSSYGWASAIGTEPNLQSAPRDPGTAWTKMKAPTDMTNGAKGSAVTYDGTHYVIVSGNWNAGIWRYIEP
jgi:BNR-Asp box repeat protein